MHTQHCMASLFKNSEVVQECHLLFSYWRETQLANLGPGCLFNHQYMLVAGNI